MFFFILILLAIWGFASDAPPLVKVFSWCMVFPIFIMTLIDVMGG
jgi:hypothetical protein